MHEYKSFGLMNKDRYRGREASTRLSNYSGKAGKVGGGKRSIEGKFFSEAFRQSGYSTDREASIRRICLLFL
jgi:hypothetical protein